jgi:translation initiation factor 2 alpha subunit (eIF-2alpha)
MKNVNIYGVQVQMDLFFNLVCEKFNLESSDIPPELQDRLDNCGEELLDILEEFMDAGNVWLTTNKSDEDIISLSNVYKLTL